MSCGVWVAGGMGVGFTCLSVLSAPSRHPSARADAAASQQRGSGPVSVSGPCAKVRAASRVLWPLVVPTALLVSSCV